MKNDIRENTIRQGYIFEGTEGIGKKTAARLFAKSALCTGEEKPCGRCHSCAMFDALSHPDVFFIEDLPVKIEAVRDLNDSLYVKPMISDRKVFVIENAGDMNAAAQNALLKSFEEPPSYAVIILITESVQKLLPTIISRGTRIVFEPFPTEVMQRFIEEKYSLSGERARFAALYSSGLPGRAEKILEDEEFFKKRAEIIESLCNLTKDKTSIFEAAKALGADGRKMPEETDMYFDVFISFFRDAAVMKSGGRIINSDFEGKIGEFSSRVRAAGARRAALIAAEVKAELNTSMKYDLHITNMLIKCWEEIHGTGNRS